MATESRKETRIYLRSKEATAGTEDDYDFCEARSVLMTKPAPVFMSEMDRAKAGAGEFGRTSEVQSVYTPFSLKASRLSEIAYFMSFFQGETDVVETINGGDAYKHQLDHQAVSSRTLPTFTMLYQDGVTTHPMNHCIISDFEMTFANGGNGLVDCTFNGFCNMHEASSGSLVKSTVQNAWSSGTHDTAIALEPLLNYKCLSMWIGTAIESTPLVQSAVSMTTYDLTGQQDITSLLNSITIGGNNGIDGESLIRAGGCGVLNNQERGDRSYTISLNVRKDDSTPSTGWLAQILADTQSALELQFAGPIIGATSDRYAMNIIYPKVQFMGTTEDDESPVNEELALEVFQDTSDTAMVAYFQNDLSVVMNATL